MSQLQATYKEIWALAFPLILGNIAQTMIAVSDTAFMGRVGSTELAAIGYVSLFYLILFMLGFSYTKGSQILIARKMGEKEIHKVGLVVDNTFVVLSTLAIFIILLLQFFSDDFFGLILNDQAVIDSCLEFLTIRKFGLLFSFAGAIMLAYYMGIAKTIHLAIAIFTMSAINIILNYILIFGKFGAPALGIAGAAWASNIAEACALLLMIGIAIFNKWHILHNLFTFKKITPGIIRTISNISFPLLLQSLFGLGGWFIFFTLIEKLGERALAISNVVKMIYMFVGIPTFGFATATNTIVSNVYGQKRYDEIFSVLKRIIIMSSLFALSLMAILFLFPKQILFVFTNDAELIKEALPSLHAITIALLFYSVSTVYFNGIVSIGRVKVSLLIESTVISLYLVYIYIVFYKLPTTLFLAWTSEWFYWSLIAIISFLYLRFGGWSKKLS
ncbi:MAG: MATE family efflux transporter [Bacteroidia bacterium]|nr:MATE family efflux transporter [Bacteroidia bacterium]